jgi:pre-mRNA-splicing factor ATP-dependent RNA helicase DHX15/PRP43
MSFQIRADGIMDPEGRYPNPLTNQPYSKSYRYLAMEKRKPDGRQDGWVQFDTWRDRIDIIKKIHKSNILLVKIPPGTGKTVIIPKLLLHYFGYQRPVLCTGPKQVTVEKAAEYAAKCLDVPYYAINDKGEEIKNPEATSGEDRYRTDLRLVGYKHGNEKKMSNSSTKLLFTTDGWVKETILRSDPNLANYGGVIVDEVHERSVNIDIVIALLMEIVKRRPDFKVIFVSATMDLDLFKEYMKRIGLGNAYTTYTLQESKLPFTRTMIQDAKRMDSMQIVDTVYKKINEIILNPQLPVGNILAFITSDPETGKIRKKIEKNMKNYPVNNKPYPIAFSRITPPYEQLLATEKNSLQRIKPTPDAPQGFARKVIIGTNVVESSVTFDDPIVYVIETGLAYEKIYDAKNYCYNTGKFEIAKASIDQRCGRTGRTCDGTCYQLYRQSDFDKFKDFTPPKILQEDLTGDFLNIIIMPMNGNLQKGLEFLSKMIEPPKNYQPAIYRAYNNLLNMDLIDSAGNITMLGRICNSFNKFDLKIAKMVVCSFYLQCHNLAIPLGAILQTVMGFDDIFYKPPGMDDNPELEKQYEANIRRLKDDRGDHMTLLRLYYFWINSPNPNAFAEQYGLDGRTLSKIQRTEKDLMKEAEKVAPYLANLNLFNMPNLLPGVQAGGYTTSDLAGDKAKACVQAGGYTTSDLAGDKADIANFQPYRFDGEVDYEEELDLLEGGGEQFESGDSSDEDDHELHALDKMPNSVEIDSIIQKMHGGLGGISGLGNAYDDTGKRTALLLNNLATRGESRDAINSETVIQNYNTSIDLFNITGSYGGGRSTDDYRSSRNDSTIQKTGMQGFKTYKNNGTGNRGTKKRNLISNLSFERIILEGGAKKHDDKAKDKETDANIKKRLERNKKIMEVITLKGLPQKTLSIPDDHVNRLYAALFYGYSNNIATYAGSGKKYHVKFSQEKGSINKTVFDYNTENPTPAWVIYNEFSITKLPGRPDDARLSIVSELKQQDFLIFLDINEIRKQL